MPTTAVEVFFQSFIQRGEVDAVYVSDLQGRIIIDSTAFLYGEGADGWDDRASNNSANFGNNNSLTAGGYGGLVNPQNPNAHRVTFTSNVTVSGGQVIRHMNALKFGGVNSICAQYKDYIVAQFVDGSAVVTLLGRRSDYQCAGQLLSLIQTMNASSVFRDMVAAIKKGED